MNLILVLPEITLFCGALLILMADVFFGQKKIFNGNFYLFSYLIALLTCALSAILLFKNINIDQQLLFNKMFLVSVFTNYSKLVIILLLSLIIYLGRSFLNSQKKIGAEILALLMIASSGSMLLISSADLMTLYLTIELQALSLYLLAAIKRDSVKSSEAGIKYFILGSVASAIMLFGISMIYGFAGSTNFQALKIFYSSQAELVPITVIFGFLLVITAMFFKISAAPFHMWAPDVYEGSASVVTTFFATIAKFSAVIILLRIFTDVLIYQPGINYVLIATALISLLIGSFGALKQQNFKRLLAYSGIADIGFIILAISALNYDGLKAAILYILIYSIISMGTFGFAALIEDLSHNKEAKGDLNQEEQSFKISSLAGLSKTNPVMAFSLAVLMLSIAGIPPFAGFFAKFYAFMAFLSRGHIVLTIIAILFSVVGAYYYLRIVKIMYFDEPAKNQVPIADNFNIKLVIFLSAIINLAFLILLNPMLSIINDIIRF
jgi:NADH-quinone oxidoreductase subunit N